MEKVDIVNKQLSSVINDESQIFVMRSTVEKFLTSYQFRKTFISDVLIIISEFGTNLVKYASGNRLLLFRLLRHHKGEINGVEIISCDSGTNTRDFEVMLKDGFSSSGSLGMGIGSISRLSDELLHFARPGFGNTFICRKYKEERKGYNPAKDTFDFTCTSQAGHDYSGDAVARLLTPDGQLIMVADGLGHGYQASLATSEAVKIFKENGDKPIDMLMEMLSNGLRKTRGAVVAIAQLLENEQKLRYTGTGNISGRIFSPSGQQGLVSHPGIVGGVISKKHIFEFNVAPGSVLVMHTDGLKSASYIKNLNTLYNMPATAISTLLFSKLVRNTDDAALAVLKT